MNSNVRKFKNGFMGYLRKDFTEHHLSGNLLRTTEIVDEGNYSCVIRIPARVYNMPLYIKKGIFMYEGSKSYATRLNEEGSKIEYVQRRSQNREIKRTRYIGNHKGYIDKSIDAGVKAIEGRIERNGIRK